VGKGGGGALFNSCFWTAGERGEPQERESVLCITSNSRQRGEEMLHLFWQKEGGEGMV